MIPFTWRWEGQACFVYIRVAVSHCLLIGLVKPETRTETSTFVAVDHLFMTSWSLRYCTRLPLVNHEIGPFDFTVRRKHTGCKNCRELHGYDNKEAVPVDITIDVFTE